MSKIRLLFYAAIALFLLIGNVAPKANVVDRNRNLNLSTTKGMNKYSKVGTKKGAKMYGGTKNGMEEEEDENEEEEEEEEEDGEEEEEDEDGKKLQKSNRTLYNSDTDNSMQRQRTSKNEITVCGETNVKTMKPLPYTSVFDGDRKKILRADKPFNISDKFETLFTGFVAPNKDNDGGKCVVIKVVEIDTNSEDDEDIYGNGADGSKSQSLVEMRHLNEFFVVEEIQKIARDKRQHLMEMLDVGELKSQNSQVKVLAGIEEPRLDDFHEWIYGKNTYFRNDEQFEEQIRELVWPVRELHQMAIHLDLRPANFVFVKGEGKELLKLANFGNSELIPVEKKMKKAAMKKRANSTKVPKVFHNFIPEYASPELHESEEHQEGLISVKADMWALGMVLYELLVLQNPTFYKLRPKKMEEADPKEMDKLNEKVRKRLSDIGALYKGFSVDPKKGLVMPIEYAEYKWPYSHWDALYDILRIWRHFPRAALLITNLLDLDLNKRMTTKGVLDYLDGKCYPGEMDEYSSSGDVLIFNQITAGDFMAKIEEKIDGAEKRRQQLGAEIRKLVDQNGGKVERVPRGVKQRIEEKQKSQNTLKKNVHKWTKLRHWLKHAVKQREKVLNGIGQRRAQMAHCDTDTTELEDDELEVEQDKAKAVIKKKKKDLIEIDGEIEEEEEPKEAKRNKPFGGDSIENQQETFWNKTNVVAEDEELKGKKLEEWKRIQNEIEHYEELQERGKLLKMPTYEKCVKSTKVDIENLKKQAARYIAMAEKGDLDEVPNPPMMTKDPVMAKSDRKAPKWKRI